MTRKMLVILVVLSILLTACDVLSKPEATVEVLPTLVPSNEIIAEGHVVPGEYARLGFAQGGIVGEVLVEEGQIVAKGDALIRLDSTLQAEAALAAAKAELTAVQFALEDLDRYAYIQQAMADQALLEAQKAKIAALDAVDTVDTDTYREKVDDQKIAVVDAETELKDAQEEFDQYKDLDVENQKRKNAQNALDDAREKFNRASRDYDLLVNAKDMAAALLAVADAHLADAEKDVEARKYGPDADDLAQAQANLDAANARVLASEKVLEDMAITAPFAGKIITMSVSIGEAAVPMQPVIILASEAEWYVETIDLTEMDVVYLEPGQRVRVVPDALPELMLNGTIESIDDLFSEQSGDITYTVRIRLEEKPPELRWGMTVSVRMTKKDQ